MSGTEGCTGFFTAFSQAGIFLHRLTAIRSRCFHPCPAARNGMILLGMPLYFPQIFGDVLTPPLGSLASDKKHPAHP